MKVIFQVIRKEIGGSWELRATDDVEVWEPWIIDNDGKEYNLFLRLYDELHEMPQCSITGAVSALIDLQ